MSPLPATTDPLDKPRAFATTLKRWFRKHGRDYPWRRTQDPYRILVSEFMLQQTRIATVLDRGYYERWLERFPNPSDLAEAPEEEVLRAWEGLGYYRRARNLQAAARVIVEKHDGKFPCQLDEILALPGVGPYTAGAVATFAYGFAVPIVDGNIARVLARLFRYQEPIDSTPGQRDIWALAGNLVPKADPRAYNSGLMELGQRICLPRNPKCDSCPVAPYCAVRRHNPEALPNKRDRPKVTRKEEPAIFHFVSGRVLLQQEEGSQRTGFWKLPSLPTGNADPLWADWPVLETSMYTITRYRVRLSVYAPPPAWRPASDPKRQARLEWKTRREASQLPMATPHRKALDRLFDQSERASPS